MWLFRGNISGIVLSQQQNLPMVIDNFLLVNKTGGGIGVNVYLIKSGVQVSIMPLNKQLAAGEVYESDRPVCMLATEQIKIQTSGSTDYDFEISNLETP